MIQFLLNNTLVQEAHLDPNLTVLNYLRRHRQRTGSKEGCASGDCGACTVTLGRVDAGRIKYETVNSCLTLVSALQGKQLITVDDLRQGTELHPAQQAMVDCHASQCGFCTPGFVMSLFCLQKQQGDKDRHQIEQALAGNLCRCTGYRPIVAAAEQLCAQPSADRFDQQEASIVQRLDALQSAETEELTDGVNRCLMPKTVAQLAQLYQQYPQAKLVAGGTDLTLAITQQYQALPQLIALASVAELKQCSESATHFEIGAAASLDSCGQFLAPRIPAFSEMLQRFASQQIRYQGTLGGNIANASPIGDASPTLLALNATLRLQRGTQQRELPLDQFFTGYRQTRLDAGEFIHSILIPKNSVSADFAAWKVSKRLDDDISAVFGAFNLQLTDGRVTQALIAFGGLAATPQRAYACEAALIGQPLNMASVEQACRALAQDFQPLSDFRASAAYRLRVAGNLLRRYTLRHHGELAITEVTRYVS
ncbi:xanthine dehydrogenase small subunit [Erwinia sp. V71]|uniref:xanthine dehydrogenase small subunit n=1 Tax=Erwinia sp. V71 TaxID=3369424 RepID=UPI003F610A21